MEKDQLKQSFDTSKLKIFQAEGPKSITDGVDRHGSKILDLDEIGEYFIGNFNRSLDTLKVNSLELINVLTDAAINGYKKADQIVDSIVNNKNAVDLYKLYLMDSILKNIGGAYLDLISKVLADVFTKVFTAADVPTRKKMYLLRHSWNPVLSPQTLLSLDIATNAIDGNWPLNRSSTYELLRPSDNAKDDNHSEVQIASKLNKKTLKPEQLVTDVLDIGGTKSIKEDSVPITKSIRSRKPSRKAAEALAFQNIQRRKGKSSKITAGQSDQSDSLRKASQLTVPKSKFGAAENIQSDISLRQSEPTMNQIQLPANTKKTMKPSHNSQSSANSSGVSVDSYKDTQQSKSCDTYVTNAKNLSPVSNVGNNSSGVNLCSANSSRANLCGDNSSRCKTQTAVVNSSWNTSTSNSTILSERVTDYESSFEQPSEMKRRRIAKSKKLWEVAAVFPNSTIAKEVVAKENTWSTTTTNITAEGKKVIYRCNKAKLRGKQCDSGMCLLYECNSERVIMYKATNAHTCANEEISRPHIPLTNEMKDRIRKYFMDGIRKRKGIQTKLNSEKIPLPSKNQLNNFIKELRCEILGATEISLGELQALVDKYSAIPEDENSPFVVSYDFDYNNVDFKLFVSSKTLLKNAVDAKLWSADSTYKMTWQGFPLSPSGTVDKDRHFHLFGCMLSKDEATKDFQFMFQSVKHALQKIFNHEANPTILIADAAGAIHNGFKNVFGDNVLILMCWFHMKKAVKKILKKLVNSDDICAQILTDLDTLQLSRTPEMFETASALFLLKYKKQKQFCEYFKNEWLVANRNWYEGATSMSVSSTNNPMESWNRVTKDEKTLRERYPLHTFFNLLLEWTTEWSEEYTNGAKKFIEVPTIELPLWTSTYKWVRLNKVLKRKTDEETGLFYYDIAAGKDVVISKTSSTDWKNFKAFKDEAFKEYRTYVSDDWINGSCNCPAFLKLFICKHIILIAVRLKLVNVPIEAKALPLDKKRKRGRPSKARQALIKQ